MVTSVVERSIGGAFGYAQAPDKLMIECFTAPVVERSPRWLSGAPGG
jgi:hypothetical protein